MKRAPLVRKTPLRCASPIARKTPLKTMTTIAPSEPIKRKSKLRSVNPERRKEKHVRNFDGGIDHDTWIRALPCCVCELFNLEQSGPTQAAHVVARGMGGAKGAWFDTLPLCAVCHSKQEAMSKRSDSHARLKAVAHELAVRHLAAALDVNVVFPNPETGRA
jgi:hypothetical protein